MGRLRSGKDAAFLCRVTQEVTDLFGQESATLFRHHAREADNLSGKDPIWDEPTTTVKFTGFDLPMMWFDWNATADAVEHGREDYLDATGWITVNHLIAAGVPKDYDGEYVSPGDTIAVHTKCGGERVEYDIIQTNREGWIDSSDKFTQYSLELKRRDKYIPNRKTS